jgi:hypothetical protein
MERNFSSEKNSLILNAEIVQRLRLKITDIPEIIFFYPVACFASLYQTVLIV